MGIVTNPVPDNDLMLNDDPHSNNTMNDQPVMDNVRNRDINNEHNNILCNDTEATEGSSTKSCSTPAGEKEQLQHANKQETSNGHKKTQGDETCYKPDNSVPV